MLEQVRSKDKTLPQHSGMQPPEAFAGQQTPAGMQVAAAARSIPVIEPITGKAATPSNPAAAIRHIASLRVIPGVVPAASIIESSANWASAISTYGIGSSVRAAISARVAVPSQACQTAAAVGFSVWK